MEKKFMFIRAEEEKEIDRQCFKSLKKIFANVPKKKNDIFIYPFAFLIWHSR